MRKLASIQTITALNPIEGADAILTASVLGWNVVVGKDEFKVGDQCIYIEIDSIVPKENPVFDFLAARKYRVRTIKLRGQISQGLCIPFSKFEDAVSLFKGYTVGDDVTELLGIVKYDPEATQENLLRVESKSRLVKYLMKYSWFRKLRSFFTIKVEKGFPSHVVSKTDEERIQSMPSILSKQKGRMVTITEKLDGQSYTATLVKNKGFARLFSKYTFTVASRNLKIGLNATSTSYINVTLKYNIKRVLSNIIGNYDSVAIQGEICGPGIQKNKYKLTENELFVFNIIANKKGKRIKLIPTSVQTLAEDNGLKSVPVLDTFTLDHSVDDLVKLSASETSRICKGVKREGIVVRNFGVDNDFSFKVINPEFLLKHEE